MAWLLVAPPPVLDGHPAQPADEDDRGQRKREVDGPVAGVSDYWLAWERSHRASVVNPTMMPSIQYWDRTAACASL